MRKAVIVCFLLAGCGGGETVFLENDSHHRVQCGPYGGGFVIAAPGDAGPAAASAARSDANSMERCLRDFNRQGYRRIDPKNPPK